ncbi:MAG: HU family DNA-binding protein [Candidatus Omnitrophota bacterium]
MTKKEIVLQIAEETGLKQVDVKLAVQRVFDIIVDALAKGETVELRNFGIFKVKSRRGRIGRNPRTGTTVPVPPKKVAVFKPGLIMKQKVK